jgi:FHS family glucose/mannose:H+ symporter-like MFS transporter
MNDTSIASALQDRAALRDQDRASSAGPSAAWLAAGLLLAGLGTVMLGPVLPVLAHHWTLTDEQSGWLFQAKFIGACLGGMTVPRRLRLGILAGTILSCAGFGAFALSTGLRSGCATLFVSGLGLGQIIASSNILAGRRYAERAGAALSTLNFFFSLGAILTGVLAAAVMPRFGLRTPLFVFAGAFLLVGFGGALMRSRGHNSAPLSGASPTSVARTAIPFALLAVFALALVLYGGLETCMTGWLTTFTLRFSDERLLGGQSPLVLLWAALTAGRLLTGALLRWLAESTLQRLALGAAAICIAALAVAHRGAAISALCILLGLSLAPFFPLTFAMLLRRGPSARAAGTVIALSGLGAAFFPWLMGVVSTHSGSLRNAMLVPLLLAVALLALSFAMLRPAPRGLPTER